MIKTNKIEDIIAAIKEYVATSKVENSIVVAIDGMSASGKTTLANEISNYFSVDVIHMDDFFLPCELRTENRYNEIGGNVHYERFTEEVLPHLKSNHSFKYSIFDCSLMDYNGVRNIKESSLRIVEGSYSQHPYFKDYADIKIFCKIDTDKQLDRIIKRNGEEKAVRFKNEWIPLEERYFKSLNLDDNIIFTN